MQRDKIDSYLPKKNSCAN
ncbi:hypothetical protein OLT16_00385 [Campylobacter jejuni]|nr:hypothetical protein [Campylobacter jejuni]